MLKFLLVLLMTAVSCCEYRILDKDPVAEAVADNYRTYYEIFIGGFSDSNKDGLGDINGVISRLDYLNDGNPNSGKSLGVEGIWLMPVMPSPSYHKYDITDYYSIDPGYGTMADFEKLVAECNKRDIRLIIDLVLNHTSERHSWFISARNAIKEGNLEDKYAKYYTKKTRKIPGRTWYKFEKTPNGTQYYYEANFSPCMPELDLDNHDVRHEITDIVKFWLGKGIGGFRLDAVKYFHYGEDLRNIQFLKWLNGECRKVKDDVYIVAENWSPAVSIQNYYEAVNCFDFGMSGTEGDIYNTVQGDNSVTEFLQRLALYQRHILQKNSRAILNPFISNHDMDRAADFLDVDEYAMQMAANLYILSSGCPFIYYGEEIGMKGSNDSAPTDANRRLAMLWDDGDTVRDPAGSSYDRARQANGSVKSQLSQKNSLFVHYKNLIMLRRANPEIARGLIEPLDFSQYTAFGGFVSDYNGSKAAVFHNTGENEITVDLAGYTDVEFSEVRGYAGKGRSGLCGSILSLSGYTSVVIK